jgi:hypothetical protein
MQTSEKTGRVQRAIRRVQTALPLIAKTVKVQIDARVEKHAPHDEIWEQLQPLCDEHGLTVTQGGKPGPNGSQWITTRITWTNDDGTEEQWIEGEMLVASPRPGFRDFGAFWSYARRISLLALFGIVAGGDEPDQHEAEKMREARPPRADRAARPAGAPRDGAAEAERVLKELSELPPNATADQVNALSRQLNGLTFKPELTDRISAQFAAKRKALGL